NPPANPAPSSGIRTCFVICSRFRYAPPLARTPIHSASVFVAFAGMGGTPENKSAGNAIKLPPPATALIAPPSNPAANRKMARCTLKRTVYHEYRQATNTHPLLDNQFVLFGIDPVIRSRHHLCAAVHFLTPQTRSRAGARRSRDRVPPRPARSAGGQVPPGVNKSGQTPQEIAAKGAFRKPGLPCIGRKKNTSVPPLDSSPRPISPIRSSSSVSTRSTSPNASANTPNSSIGITTGTRLSTPPILPSGNGSSAASSTPATTAWIAISSNTRTRPPSSSFPNPSTSRLTSSPIASSTAG